MRIIKILSALLALTPVVSGYAAEQPYETLETSNGSIYMGHSEGQELSGKKAKTIFATDSAILVVSVSPDVTMTSDEVPLDAMTSDEWKTWFEAHPEYVRIDRDGKKRVTMHRIKDNVNNRNGQVFLLEKGPKHYKYFSRERQRDSIVNDSIKSSTFAGRDALDLSGIITEIGTTDNSKYEGQLVFQDNEYIGLKTDAGYIELIPAGKISYMNVSAFNPEQSITEQVQYLDELSTPETTYRGVIVSRNYRPGGKQDAYFEILEVDGNNRRNIKKADIKSIRKTENHKYSPKRDALITEDFSVIANGVSLDSISYQVETVGKDKSNLFVLREGAEPTEVTLKNGGLLNLQMKDVNLNKTIYVIKVDAKKLNDKDKEKRYTFSHQDLVDKNRQPEMMETTRNGNITVGYALTPNTYLIYRPTDKTAFLINVQN